MTPATFIQLFPEFRDTSANLINAKLMAAAAYMGGPDQGVWGTFAATGTPMTKADLGQANLAAHWLIKGPEGTGTYAAPDSDKSDETPYLRAWNELVEGLAQCVVVSGGRRR